MNLKLRYLVLLFFLFSCSINNEQQSSNILFDFDWKFALGDQANANDPLFDDSAWRMLDLPHDFSIEQPFSSENKTADGGAYSYGGIGWYRKHFILPMETQNKRVTIQFDGVYRNSEVWINGTFLGKRPYGYSSFEYNLTPYLNQPETENVICVKVDTKDQPNSRWYTGAGIYRHVSLHVSNEIHLVNNGVFIQTSNISEESAKVKISAEIDGLQEANKKLKVNTIIKDANQKVVYKKAIEIFLQPNQLNNIETEFQITNPSLWSIENPNLYNLTVQLKEGRKILDSYETSVGIRSIRFDPDHGLFLNNKHVKLKGTNNHHDGGPLGAACYDYTFERQLRILKSLGSNAIRVSHNPPSPELLYWADRLGFLVIDEIFDEWENGKKPFGYSPSFMEWHKKDVSDWIRRDRNHPSIIAWSLGNEVSEQRMDTTGTRILGELINEASQHDNSRPFTAACNEILAANKSGFSSQLGIVGYNYQEPNYKKDHLTYPSRIIYGSETVIYPYQPGDGFPLHSYEQWVEGQVEDYIAGEFLWTGFDYLGEVGIGMGGTGLEPWNTWPKWPWRSAICGLVDICGFEKPAYWFRKTLWNDEPQVYIAVPTNLKANNIQEVPFWGWPEVQAHWNDQNISELLKVQVYTNCKEVELFLNGKSLGSKNYDIRKEAFLTWDVAYEPGNIEAIGTTVDGLKTSFKIQTSDVATKMIITSERETIKANKQDVSYFKLELVDENNIPVPFANNLIKFEVTGEGELVAIGNGDPTSHTSFKGKVIEAFNGRCLAIVKSTEQPGIISVKASCDGMESVNVNIESK